MSLQSFRPSASRDTCTLFIFFGGPAHLGISLLFLFLAFVGFGQAAAGGQWLDRRTVFEARRPDDDRGRNLSTWGFLAPARWYF